MASASCALAEDPFIATKPGEPDIPLNIKGGALLASVPGLYSYIVAHSTQQLPGLDILQALHKAGPRHSSSPVSFCQTQDTGVLSMHHGSWLQLNMRWCAPLQKSMEHPISGMCSPADSVPLLQFLLRAVNAKKVVECGVFTGESPPSIWFFFRVLVT